MITLTNIAKSYDDTRVFEALNFTFEKGRIYSIFGRNGVGKTTLLKLIGQYLTPDSGEVNNSLSTMLITPDSFAFDYLTGRELIAFTLSSKGLAIDEAIIDQKMQDFGLLSQADHYVLDYSKGMKFKLLLIISLLAKPEVLLLDEPFAELDILTLQLLETVLNNEKQRSIIIFSTHVPSIAQRFSDEILFLSEEGLDKLEDSWLTSPDLERHLSDLMKVSISRRVDRIQR